MFFLNIQLKINIPKDSFRGGKTLVPFTHLSQTSRRGYTQPNWCTTASTVETTGAWSATLGALSFVVIVEVMVVSSGDCLSVCEVDRQYVPA